MKSRVLLLVITIVVVAALGIVMGGCSCSSKKDSDAKNATLDQAVSKKDGVAYVNDNFPTISPTEKTTDKDGNTVISYTNADGNKVTRTIGKDGKIHVVIKDKKGKVIKDKTFKDKTQKATKKSSSKKDSKKDSKKKDKDEDGEHAGVVNNEDGWSDFY